MFFEIPFHEVNFSSNHVWALRNAKSICSKIFFLFPEKEPWHGYNLKTV